MNTTTTPSSVETETSITFNIDPRERDKVAVIRQVVLYAALCLEADEQGYCDAETAIDMLEGAADMLRDLASDDEEDEA
jgi:hypothetical protein